MVEKHKTLSLLHVPLAIVAFAMVVSSVVMLGFPTRVVSEQPPLCEPGYDIVNPSPSQPISNQFPLEVYVPGGGTLVEQVKFFLGTDGLGNATQVSGNTGLWRLSWDTSSTYNGNYPLSAEVSFIGAIPDCRIPPQQVIIDNQGATTASNLSVEIMPDNWVGPPNINFQFHAVALLEDGQGNVTDVSNDTSFTWVTSIGSVNSFGPTGDFFSGPSTGEGDITVFANYGTQSEDADASIKISQTSGFPYPDGTEPDDDSDDSESSAEKPVEGDRQLAQCIRERIGDEEFEALVDDGTRLSPEQFDQARNCFARQSFVIPASLAPFSPDNVRELPEDNRLFINDPQNVTIGDDNRQGLEFNGQAVDPDSNVLIYIFSEPLVLTTVADSSGRWSYTLEDPLEAGEHEAYVLVETDEGYRRSSNIVFAINEEDSTESNPNGYGLTLASTTSSEAEQSTMIYLALVSAVVLAAAVFLTRFVWFRKKATAVVPQEPDFQAGVDKSAAQGFGPVTVEEESLDANDDKKPSSDEPEIVNPANNSNVDTERIEPTSTDDDEPVS